MQQREKAFTVDAASAQMRKMRQVRRCGGHGRCGRCVRRCRRCAGAAGAAGAASAQVRRRGECVGAVNATTERSPRPTVGAVARRNPHPTVADPASVVSAASAASSAGAQVRQRKSSRPAAGAATERSGTLRQARWREGARPTVVDAMTEEPCYGFGNGKEAPCLARTSRPSESRRGFRSRSSPSR